LQTVITKWGNSQGIRIPKNVLQAAKINIDDKVEITTENNSIIIRKATNDVIDIQTLFAHYKGDYPHIEIDWGKLVGREVW